MNACTWTLMVTVAVAAWACRAASGAGGAPVPTTQPAPAESNSVATLKTSQGGLTIHPINHSAIRFEFRGKQYYVDPSGQADWDKLPKADAILITHEHFDHFDRQVIDKIKKDGTVIVASTPAATIASLSATKAPPAGMQPIAAGQVKTVLDANVEAVAAYNMTADRLRYHPKERGGCGFVFTFGDRRVYVAGDTEATPEMKALKDIDAAFLPINLPYTMTPKEAAEAARAFKPKVLYPYHQGKSDPNEVKRTLSDEKAIEVRVLPLP